MKDGKTTILAKIFETNFNVSVKKRTTGKVQFQFLNSFSLVLTKFSFWEEDWVIVLRTIMSEISSGLVNNLRFY